MTTVGFCLAHLHTGGIERNVVRLLGPLAQRGITPVLFLQYVEGDLLHAIPDGVRVVDLGGRGMLGTARALRKALQGAPVDVLCTATNALNIAALLAARMMRHPPKVVVGEHIPLGPFLATRKNPALRRALMRWLYPRAAGCVAPSQPIIDEHLALLGTRAPACHVLPNPVVDDLTPLPPQPDRARRIVSLGRFSPDKDFALALQAFAHLTQADPQARLTLWGQGEERDALIAQARELDLTRQVAMPGVTRDVPSALAQADMFICTSRVEGFGNAIVEAQAAGVPILSVDCPFGPRILLEDGAAGCLVPSRDPQDLGAALVAFANDAAWRTQAAHAAHAIAGRYTIAASAQAHAAYFQQIAGLSRG